MKNAMWILGDIALIAPLGFQLMFLGNICQISTMNADVFESEYSSVKLGTVYEIEDAPEDFSDLNNFPR